MRGRREKGTEMLLERCRVRIKSPPRYRFAASDLATRGGMEKTWGHSRASGNPVIPLIAIRGGGGDYWIVGSGPTTTRGGMKAGEEEARKKDSGSY
jgi:hypothetical protein